LGTKKELIGPETNACNTLGYWPSMDSDMDCWSDSSRSSNPRMSSGSVMIFVVARALTNVSNIHLTWWYCRISPPVLLYGLVTTYKQSINRSIHRSVSGLAIQSIDRSIKIN